MRREPRLGEHLLLAGVAPHPERGQVHGQVVLLSLGGEIQDEVKDTLA